MPGPNPAAESFESLVNRWRSVNPLPKEDLNASLDRIRISSDGFHRPVIVLALDGVDEVGNPETTQRHISSLVWHFRKGSREIEPEGLLVVTCRVRHTFDALVAPEGTGGSEPFDVPVFNIGDFDAGEFLSVWKLWFPGEVVPDAAQQEATEPVAGADSLLPRELRMRLEALKHPALLGCARKLNPTERQQLFAGVDGVWVKLLSSYLEWFGTKISRRQNYEPNDVHEILKAVAGTCDKLPPVLASYDLETHWVLPAVDRTRLADMMVRRVFHEAISCGLVESPGQALYTMPTSMPVPWSWRFGFLQKHLAKIV